MEAEIDWSCELKLKLSTSEVKDLKKLLYELDRLKRDNRNRYLKVVDSEGDSSGIIYVPPLVTFLLHFFPDDK